MNIEEVLLYVFVGFILGFFSYVLIDGLLA